MQVQDDRGDPRPVLHRPVSALRDGGLGAVPAPAFPRDQLMPGHRDLRQRQVEDLAALHPGNRPPRQASPAAAAAGRLMAHLPVRPGRLRQRAALMPVLPAGRSAAFPPQRPRPGRRLVQPLAGRRPGRIPCDPASSPRSAASTSSLEPASSPGTPGRYYHPGSPTRRSRILAVPLGFRGSGAGRGMASERGMARGAGERASGAEGHARSPTWRPGHRSAGPAASYPEGQVRGRSG
jgi:hypothetical protein